MSRPADFVYLDPAEAAVAQRRRQRYFHTIEVPRLRVVGFLFCTIGIVVHNWLVFGELDWSGSLRHGAVLLGYALLSWAVLTAAWDHVRVFNLGDVFLALDLIPMTYVVYVTGGDQSLMWFVLAARAADQMAISFRHALVFSHLATLAYAALIGWLVFVEGRPVNWPIETAKVVFLYILCLYMTTSARAIADRRRKFETARRMAEQAVRDAADRRRDLEHALARLEAANRSKSEFLANVSHEVRTPLNSVIGNADLLLDSPLSNDQRELLDVMRDSAESLTRIVDDILDLSRMEANRLPLESIPLRVRDVAGHTVRMFAARANQKGLTLVCHVARTVPAVVVGDPHRLRQVLTNLVNNAIKFTESGEVRIAISLDESSDERVALRFSVKDTGIGIPPARQQAIFEAFTQADGSDTRRYGGTGLGLTIAAQLVALMDGRLWVDSEEGTGSTFHFVAWFGTSPDRRSDPPWGARPLHILVAHAHDGARRAVVELLAPWPTVTVAEASGGRATMAALEVARDAGRPFDIALADAALPGLDGFELAARVRVSPRLVGHMVILLPTTQLATGLDRATALGARALTTPVVWPGLVELLTDITTGTRPSASPHGHRVARTPLRVLVVDDHVVNQAVAGAMLRKWGHAIATALDGEEAVEKVKREPFDVVLMDLQMPTVDGLEATRRIRAWETESARPRLPIMAMTARAMTEDRAQCREAGMDGFVSKPINAQELFDLLEATARSLTQRRPAEASTATLTPLSSDPDVSRHVVELFLQTAPHQLASLREAVASRDAASIAAIAHALRGAMSHFSDTSTVDMDDLERLGRDGRHDLVPAVFVRAAGELNRLLERLQ
jgi:two-component system, sensor histidine kinase and response regulator